MGAVKQVVGGLDAGFVTTRFNDLLSWAQKYSLFQYPFVTACCGMEFMSVAGPRYDMARFGAEAPRFSPRQADLLWVVGTVSQRQAPALKRIYEQMTDPKWVLAFGTCASCGGFYDNPSLSPLRRLFRTPRVPTPLRPAPHPPSRTGATVFSRL